MYIHTHISAHNHKGRGTDGTELQDVHVLLLDTDIPMWTRPIIHGSIPSSAIARYFCCQKSPISIQKSPTYYLG